MFRLDLKKAVNGNHFGVLLLFYLIFISISFLSRTVLLLMSWDAVSLNPLNLLWSYLGGLFMDTVAFSYFMIPFVLFLMFVPTYKIPEKIRRIAGSVVYFIVFYILIFNAVSEYFFWEEFGVRYNFIAVDYLVYTTEVLGNINESYPMPALISGMIAVDILLLWLVIKKGFAFSKFPEKTGFKKRISTGALLLLLPAMSFLLVKNTTVELTKNRYNNELAKNGIHSLFAAFLNNELDYETFYATRPNDKNFEELRNLLRTENSRFVSNDTFDIRRQITDSVPEKRYNVVFITVESLSGEFLSYKGSKLGKITPYLDALADSSLFFTNLYAIGTRTVYGLEASTLASPPKPGQSLLKRPHSEDLFSIGQLFSERGYQLKFIYGGNGYFDNMNYFFSHNGFTSIDKKDLTSEEITFENAWGVCDQDLFNRTLTECDRSFASGKPFFNYVMTTSNHRPFTYPDGVIDIPSHTGRKGAVKYCDYSIGEFIRKAKSKPWFSNTIFVVMADHCAGSAGQAELPFMEYQIPLLIYNPLIIQPKTIDKLCSQIDVAPTLLGLMNFSYQTKFFGKDITKMEPEEERAFISNYQKLGYLKDGHIVILSPQQKITHYQVDGQSGEMKMEAAIPEIENEAIIYYQSANYVYKNKLNKWD